MKKRFLLIPAALLLMMTAGFLTFLHFLASLPDISALEKVSYGEETIPVYDMRGNFIYEYHSPTYGEKEQIRLSEISDEMIALTIVTEDSTFFSNPGFSPSAILRAVLQNLTLGRTYSGASTITQQIVKNILLPPEERFVRSIPRKAKEIILSAAITFRYEKETILNIYLNEIYYGQNATGVEKAAEVYFGKHASGLDLAEAAFIAGLPQAPNYYGNDPEAGALRQKEVLQVLERILRESRCIRLEKGKDPRKYCPAAEEIRELIDGPDRPE